MCCLLNSPFIITKLNKMKEKIRKLLHEYAVDNRGEDDLRGMIKVFAEIIGMSYDELIEELKWIKKYEND